jgi:hypothetical protein
MTLKKLRNDGWLCAIVEKTIPHCFIKKDLFGFIDILAIKEKEVLAIQTTCGGGSGRSNLLARIRKIEENDNYKMIKNLGWQIIVHGWKKEEKKWICEVIKL